MKKKIQKPELTEAKAKINVEAKVICRSKKYIDPETKLIAESKSKTTAWQLIRNECHKLNLPVPRMNKIYEYK